MYYLKLLRNNFKTFNLNFGPQYLSIPGVFRYLNNIWFWLLILLLILLYHILIKINTQFICYSNLDLMVFPFFLIRIKHQIKIFKKNFKLVFNFLIEKIFSTSFLENSLFKEYNILINDFWENEKIIEPIIMKKYSIKSNFYYFSLVVVLPLIWKIWLILFNHWIIQWINYINIFSLLTYFCIWWVCFDRFCWIIYMAPQYLNRYKNTINYMKSIDDELHLFSVLFWPDVFAVALIKNIKKTCLIIKTLVPIIFNFLILVLFILFSIISFSFYVVDPILKYIHFKTTKTILIKWVKINARPYILKHFPNLDAIISKIKS